jgi:hypothetical protein
MLPSSWRAPTAGVRLFSRSICPALNAIRSAAVFSSTRATRFVPGIGAMSFPCASSHARAICGCCTHLAGNGLDFIDDAEIAVKILASEARVGLAPVVVRELLGRADVAGEKAVAERRVWNEPDSQLAQQRQEFHLWVARPQGILSL